MNQDFYRKTHEYLAARPERSRVLTAAAGLLPGLVYAAYPLLLIYLAAAESPQLLRSILVPAAGFLLATALRAGLNRPRPYEVLGIPPLVEKRTRGKSFPSRHAACAAVIAVTALKVLPWLGVVLLVVALLIALTRVLAGVHFVRDAVAGLMLGAAVGIAGMYLI